MSDPYMDAFLAGVVGVVEANTYETLSLWSENESRSPAKSWEESREGGPLVTVGALAGMPVCIVLSKARIDGSLLLFFHATSQVVDHRMIDEWLDKNLPDSARREAGYINRVDAMNFHNVFPRKPVEPSNVLQQPNDRS